MPEDLLQGNDAEEEHREDERAEISAAVTQNAVAMNGDGQSEFEKEFAPEQVENAQDLEDIAEEGSETIGKIRMPASKDTYHSEWNYGSEEVKDHILSGSYNDLQDYITEYDERLQTLGEEKGTGSDEYTQGLKGRTLLGQALSYKKYESIENFTEAEKKRLFGKEDKTPLTDAEMSKLAVQTFQAMKEAGTYRCISDPEHDQKMIDHIKDNIVAMNNNGMAPALRIQQAQLNGAFSRKRMLKQMRKFKNQPNFSDTLARKDEEAVQVSQAVTGNVKAVPEGEKKTLTEDNKNELKTGTDDADGYIDLDIENPNARQTNGTVKTGDPAFDRLAESSANQMRDFEKFRQNPPQVQRSKEKAVEQKKVEEKLITIHLMDPKNDAVPAQIDQYKQYTTASEFFSKLATGMETVQPGHVQTKDEIPHLAGTVSQIARQNGYEVDIRYSAKNDDIFVNLGSGRFSKLRLGQSGAEITRNAKTLADKYRKDAQRVQRDMAAKQQQSQSQQQTQSRSQSIK